MCLLERFAVGRETEARVGSGWYRHPRSLQTGLGLLLFRVEMVEFEPAGREFLALWFSGLELE